MTLGIASRRGVRRSSRRWLKYPDPGRKALFQRSRRQTRVVFSLQIYPEPGIHAKKDTQPHCGVWGNRAATIHDVTDAAWRDVNVGGKLARRDAHLLHEVFQQDFAGVDLVKQFRHKQPLVVVHDFKL